MMQHAIPIPGQNLFFFSVWGAKQVTSRLLDATPPQRWMYLRVYIWVRGDRIFLVKVACEQ